MYLITGGAGFIGSNIVAALAKSGQRIAVCDAFGQDDRWRNIAKYRIDEFIHPDKLFEWLQQETTTITAVIHMGAISSTTEKNVDELVRKNINFTKGLWDYCVIRKCPFIYASSAATYGNGESGFEDRTDEDYMSSLRPLNPYGWSKHVFDRWAIYQTEVLNSHPPKWAGLKFFNVYGPNEYHKGAMQSVLAQQYDDVATGNPLKLFKSYNDAYRDGEQMRDFVYVEDCVSVVCWMLSQSFPNGIYNVGSGEARSWMDLANAMFVALDREIKVELKDMPEGLRARYQYFTQANVDKLRGVGCNFDYMTLEQGVSKYVRLFLDSDDRYN